MNVLTAVGQEIKKAKENLKDHVESLQKSGKELFGEDFRKILKEKAKAKKDSSSVYGSKQRPSVSASPTSHHQNKRLFPRGPSNYSKSSEGRNSQRFENNNNRNNQDAGGRKFPGQGKKFNKKFGKFTKNMVVPYSNMVPEIFPELIPLSQLNHVHPLMKKLFPEKELKNFPLAGRLRFFLTQWKKLTNDPEILSWVSGLRWS